MNQSLSYLCILCPCIIRKPSLLLSAIGIRYMYICIHVNYNNNIILNVGEIINNWIACWI